eukprot:2426353-Amphidinium_carterae.1
MVWELVMWGVHSCILWALGDAPREVLFQAEASRFLGLPMHCTVYSSALRKPPTWDRPPKPQHFKKVS